MNDLRICKDEAEVVRLMFEKAMREGLGPLRIANYLNDCGYTTRKGKRWNQSTIGRILSNRIYWGILQKGDAESQQLPELQIVDDDMFSSVQEIRVNRGKGVSENMRTIPMQTRGKSLLSGFLYCAHCGARVNGTTSRKQYRKKDGTLYQQDRRIYRCNASVDGVPVECDGPRTYRAGRIEETFKMAISALLEQLEAPPVETILEYKYQIALRERKKEYEQAQNALAEKQQDYETLRNEIAKALRGESLFQLALLRSVLEKTERAIQEKTEQLFELEAKLQNAEQLRREIQIKQLKYCGLNQIFTSGTMEEKKMLLSILVRRVEVRQGYELNIQLTPGFEQFLDGLIEMR